MLESSVVFGPRFCGNFRSEAAGPFSERRERRTLPISTNAKALVVLGADAHRRCANVEVTLDGLGRSLGREDRAAGDGGRLQGAAIGLGEGVRRFCRYLVVLRQQLW